MIQLPSVGRIVVYHWPNGQAPALITHVHSDYRVNLKVFWDTQTDSLLGDARYRVSKAPNPFDACWDWPRQMPALTHEQATASLTTEQARNLGFDPNDV